MNPNCANLQRSLFVLAALCFSPSLGATTYVYTGAPYTAVFNFTSPCAIGPCANYVVGEKVTGQFTTTAPLGSNLANQNVFPSVTSYSFLDGLVTYSSADPNSRVDNLVVSTDAIGGIVAFDVVVMRWQSGSSPHVAGDRLARFFVSSSSVDVTENNAPCAAVVTAPSGVPDACVAFAPDASTSFGDALAHGSFSVLGTPLAAIPALSGWATILLSLLVAASLCFAARESKAR